MKRIGPGKLAAADLATIAVFAALIAALGLIGTLTPFGAVVPISVQSLGVMLAGSLLGAWRGAASCVVFLVLVAAGLPLLGSGVGGLGVFMGPRAGYLIGWPIAAFVIGWLTQRMLPRYQITLGLLANITGGILVMYLIGVPVMGWRAGLDGMELLGFSVMFLPGDLIKAVVATLVAHQVHRAYPWLARRVGRG